MRRLIRKVTEHVLLDDSAQLTFEVSDGISPIGLYRAAMPAVQTDAIWIELSPRPASCRPRDLPLVRAAAAARHEKRIYSDSDIAISIDQELSRTSQACASGG